MNSKIIKLIYFLIIAIGFFAFFIRGYYQNKKAHTAFVDAEYQGIIKEIHQGPRGFSKLTIGSLTMNLGLDEQKIQNYIHISDSIVKKSGTTEIIVYRKNPKGAWQEKVFK